MRMGGKEWWNCGGSTLPCPIGLAAHHMREKPIGMTGHHIPYWTGSASHAREVEKPIGLAAHHMREKSKSGLALPANGAFHAREVEKPCGFG